MNFRSPAFFIAGIAAALALGWFVFPLALYTHEQQPLQFSHKVHTGDPASLSCDMCHEFSSDGTFTGIPAVSKCADCHSSQIGTSDPEKRLVEEYVTPHKEIPWKVYARQPDNAYFSHASHVQLGKMKCEECHGPHGESEQAPAYQENRISGYSRDIWGRNISGVPSHPWEGMKMDRCIGCHAAQNRVDGCIDCHK